MSNIDRDPVLAHTGCHNTGDACCNKCYISKWYKYQARERETVRVGKKRLLYLSQKVSVMSEAEEQLREAGLIGVVILLRVNFQSRNTLVPTQGIDRWT